MKILKRPENSTTQSPCSVGLGTLSLPIFHSNNFQKTGLNLIKCIGLGALCLGVY